MATWHSNNASFLWVLIGLMSNGSAWAAQSPSEVVQTSPSSPEAQLVCRVTYAGSAQEVITQPTANPYQVAAVDIAGRFSFKAVMVGQDRFVTRINLSVYVLLGEQTVPIQHVTYTPSADGTWPTTPPSITGLQRLYAGPLERELSYECQLTGAGT